MFSAYTDTHYYELVAENMIGGLAVWKSRAPGAWRDTHCGIPAEQRKAGRV